MIVILKRGCSSAEVAALTQKLNLLGVNVQTFGYDRTIMYLTNAVTIDAEVIRADRSVEKVVRLSEPFAAKKSGKIDIGGKACFGGAFEVIAGPCAVEGEEQIFATAAAVKKAGATMLRGGAFKPRTSPYTFQGLRKEGLGMLVAAGKSQGLPTVSEVMGIADLDLFSDVDVLQIGARNMQNYELLRAVGRFGKPVLLKRGFVNTVEEWLLSAEYVASAGNEKIILCERGVRTFASAYKATVDFATVKKVRSLTGLPVIIDPSHASDEADNVSPLAFAAAAVGADGVMIETHVSPSTALCDGCHQITPDTLKSTVEKMKAIRKIIDE